MQMRRPVIHGYSCSDHDPIEEWVPENSSEVDIYVDVYLGPDTGPVSQFFTFNVVTYNVLKMRQGNFKFICPVHEYSWADVEKWVSSVLDKCQGIDWMAMSSRLRLHMLWEYENGNNKHIY